MLVGPAGPRSGARLLLYGAMAWTLYLVLHTLIPYIEPHIVSTIRLSLIVELGLFGVAWVPALVMTRIEARPLGAYGLPRRGAFGKPFWMGALWGIGAITMMLLGMRVAGLFDFGSPALHGVRLLKLAVFWGVFFVVVGLYEEFLTRGYTQLTLAKGVGFWPAAVLLSIGFAVLHADNPGETAVGVVAAGCIGLFLCLTLRRTGNLWFAVGFHAAWDWGESYLYSVPDSGGMVPGHLLKSHLHGPSWLTGGSVGPEGSVLVFVVVALLWVAFDRTYPEVKYQG
jgi:membrane protease YdiL (CAAX protease family)